MRRLIAPLLVLTGLFAPPARADLQAELKDTFQGLLNVTPAESYATQRRGVISGGSIELRTNLTTPNLISFVPPSLKAGCGGIDLFGGSFSFINGQQLNQLMRNIAQMATSYAFQLAIEGLCPTCAQIMTKLQKDVQFINGLLRGDCGRVKQLVDSSIGPTVRGWSEEIGRFTATSLDTEHGFLEDAFKGLEQTPSPSATAVQHGQAAVLTGNTVKQALDESATVDWYVHGDNDLKAALMSLTGTMIAGLNPNRTDLEFKFAPPILKVRDFIEGGNVEIYDCQDPECLLDGLPKKTITLTGLRERVRTMLFGTGICRGCAGGIVRKLGDRDGGQSYTGDEQKFIEATSPGVLGLLERVASQPGAVTVLAERIVDVQAVEMAHRLVEEMLSTVRAAIQGTGPKMDNTMLGILRDLSEQIRAERERHANDLAGVDMQLQIYENLDRALHQPVAERTPK